MTFKADGLDRLVERMRNAEQCWTSARGTFREWRNQDLVARAWQDRYGLDGHAEAPAVGSVTVLTAVPRDEHASPAVAKHVWRVAVTGGGERVRADAVSRTVEEWTADIVVVERNRFWTRTGQAVETYDGNVPGGHGAVDFLLLLRPRGILEVFDLALTGETERIAGRMCDEVRATLKDSSGDGLGLDAEVLGMISGGDDFCLYIDAETGVVLRAVKYVHGEPAEGREFIDIEFDLALDVTLFQPPD